MENEEIAKYARIVDSFKSKYRFGFSSLSFLTLKKGIQGGIGGLVIDRPDIITVKPIVESSNLDFYGGVVIVEDRHLSEESEFLKDYLGKIRSGFFLGYDESKEDLEMLLTLEKALFEHSLPDLVSRQETSRNVIALRQ